MLISLHLPSICVAAPQVMALPSSTPPSWMAIVASRAILRAIARDIQYQLELLASDAVPDKRRLILYALIANRILRTELASERDWLPMLDYQVFLEELNNERLRVRLEVEWNADE
jgi:hypothetical protein